MLVDGGLVLYETAAICLHLADRHAGAGLAPVLGSNERAEFYKWLVYLTNTVQAELILYFYPERLADDAAAAAQIKTHAESRVGDMLDLIEAKLAAGTGPFLLGAQYRAVDPYLLMLCRWTRGIHNPARNRSHLGRFLDTVMARPATQRAFAAEGIAAPTITSSNASGSNGWRIRSGRPAFTARSDPVKGPRPVLALRNGVRAPSTT